MNTDKKIIYQEEGNAAIITLNNPAKMNCMGFEMLHQLHDAVQLAAKSETVKVLVLKGAGERAFSTGADLKEFQTLPEDKAAEWIEYGNAVFNAIENMNKPTIAFINGYAMGGGLELALACDFRIATASAVFCSPELQHGWLPGWGGMTRLRRLIGEAKAKEVVMLCERMQASTLLNLGLITKIDNENSEELNKLVLHLSSLKPQAFNLAKTALQDTNRTTYGPDIQFDVLAMQIANQ